MKGLIEYDMKNHKVIVEVVSGEKWKQINYEGNDSNENA